MIGHPSGEREPTLDGVEPVHRIGRLPEPPGLGETEEVTPPLLFQAEEVAIEREHDLGAIEQRPHDDR